MFPAAGRLPWCRTSSRHNVTAVLIAESFLVLVAQELILALGVALAGANAWALFQNRRRRKAYERALAEYQTQKGTRDSARDGTKAGDGKGMGKGKRRKPSEPELAKAAPAVVNIVIGSLIALVAIASLTFDWVT